MLASMKTTIHHVAACDDCRRTTVHRTVVEHGPDARAVSSHHACDACQSRVGASAVAAPVLDMITARSVRDRSENSPAPLGRVLGAIAN